MVRTSTTGERKMTRHIEIEDTLAQVLDLVIATAIAKERKALDKVHSSNDLRKIVPHQRMLQDLVSLQMLTQAQRQ